MHFTSFSAEAKLGNLKTVYGSMLVCGNHSEYISY